MAIYATYIYILYSYIHVIFYLLSRTWGMAIPQHAFKNNPKPNCKSKILPLWLAQQHIKPFWSDWCFARVPPMSEAVRRNMEALTKLAASNRLELTKK